MMNILNLNIQVDKSFLMYNKYILNQNKLCLDAVKNGKLIVNLEKTKYDNPYIHGMILYAGGLNDTDYEEYNYMK